MTTTAISTYLNRSTPGVYVTEIDAFGTSIIGVPTAVPIFIGYTEFAGEPSTGKPLYNTPVAITSMHDFEAYFGGAAVPRFAVTPTSDAASAGAPAPVPSFFASYTSGAEGAETIVASTGFTIASAVPHQFNLYWQMRLFFANGGGDCFIVSVGSYWAGQFPSAHPDPVPPGWAIGSIAAGDASTPGAAGLLSGINAAGYASGPTMLVVPEACQLDQAGYAAVATAMLAQANALQDRVAILDLPGCMTASSHDALIACQASFWAAIAPQAASASCGVAYAPALKTSVVTIADVSFANWAMEEAGNAVVNNILTTQAARLYSGARLAEVQSAIATAFPPGSTIAVANTAQFSGDGAGYPPPVAQTPAALSQWRSTLDNLLYAALPVFAQIEQLIVNAMNIAPPSGMMAGIWTQSDMQRGVWNAPANIALGQVVAPLCAMSDVEQGDFNAPSNGQAINVLRAQPGRGTVVWGARTLDGNSNDYRYLQVRRTLILIEQSIKTALQAYVFAANDATTWNTVAASISAFLTGLWQQGGLTGSTASEAFSVSCGLGATMTGEDVLNGYMIVAVTVSLTHPAEFIALTFTQTMGR